MSTQRSSLVSLVFTLFTLLPAGAVLTNLTIDDSNLSYFTWTEDTGSPAPTLPWAAITPATPCLYCSAQPQTADIENKTWHDGSNNSAGSFTFQGSAVYIYGIDLDNPANISFAMDDISTFHYYAGTEQFVFRSLFFNATDLAAGVNHTVSWVLHATKSGGNVGLFDYAVITVDASSITASASATPTQSSSSIAPGATRTKSKSKVGPIVGGLLGGLALLAAIAIALIRLARRRRRNTSTLEETSTPPRATRVRADYVQPFVAPAPPPSNNGGAPVPATRSEKTLDVEWNNPTTTDLSSVPASQSPAPTDTSRSQTDGSTTARERFLEERLATLEAQVNQHLPPAYVQPE